MNNRRPHSLPAPGVPERQESAGKPRDYRAAGGCRKITHWASAVFCESWADKLETTLCGLESGVVAAAGVVSPAIGQIPTETHRHPRRVPRMVIRFVVLAPDSKKGSFAVRLPIIVGRSEEAKFRIQQDRVSRKHCEFFSADGRVFIRDLGSTNGTFLEDEQVPTSAKVPVPSGAVVRVGSLVFRVEYEEATDGTTTATGPRIDEADDATLDTQSTGDDGDVAGVNLEPMDEAEPPPPVTEEAPEESAGPVFTDVAAAGDDEPQPEEEPADLDAALEGLPAATDAEPPSAEGFAFLESATAAPEEPPAGEELQWLPPDDAAEADTPDDDKLGDSFKGLQ